MGRKRSPRMWFWSLPLLALPVVLAWLAIGWTVSRPLAVHALRLSRGPALIILGSLIVGAVAAFTVRARLQRVLPAVEAEEPLLALPSLPARGFQRAVVAVHGLAPGCGASSVAFNLAVFAAIEGTPVGGEERLPRPACLLAPGLLAGSLGLDGEELARHVEDHPYSVAVGLPVLGVRHPSGCELFCLPREGLDRDNLNRLVHALRDLYDAVVVDLPSSRDLRGNDPVSQWNATLLLLATPTVPAGLAYGWADELWWLHHQARTILVVNRVSAGSRFTSSLGLGFPYLAEIPEDVAIPALDRSGLPWGIEPGEAGRRLRMLAGSVLGRSRGWEVAGGAA